MQFALDCDGLTSRRAEGLLRTIREQVETGVQLMEVPTVRRRKMVLLIDKDAEYRVLYEVMERILDKLGSDLGKVWVKPDKSYHFITHSAFIEEKMRGRTRPEVTLTNHALRPRRV